MGVRRRGLLNRTHDLLGVSTALNLTTADHLLNIIFHSEDFQTQQRKEEHTTRRLTLIRAFQGVRNYMRLKYFISHQPEQRILGCV